MLLLASFLTVHFGEWKQSWHGTTGLAHVGDSAFRRVRWENEGVLAAIDPDSSEVLWTVILDTPSGFALDGEHIYVNSMYGNNITVLNRDLEPVDVIAKWFMNDLHSLVLTERGFLITSSGLDALIEFSESDGEIWSWFARDHGYGRKGDPRIGRQRNKRDYRRNVISTHEQATHCNSAVLESCNGNQTVLATLFHQGVLIRIDPSSGKHEVVLTDMESPHSIRSAGEGWLVCDSRNNAVVQLGSDFWVDSVIDGNFDWVQDAMLHEQQLLLADANHSRFVWCDAVDGRELRELRYSEQWKIYQVEIVEGAQEEWLRKVRSGN